MKVVIGFSLRVVLAGTAFALAVSTAIASSNMSKSGPVDSLVTAKLATTPIYIQGSSDDVLTAAVGRDSPACGANAPAMSPAHCAELATQEILRRKPLRDLLSAVQNGNIEDGKALKAIQLLDEIKGPDVDSGLRAIAVTFDTGFGHYLALKYFADKCEAWSLQDLNNRWFEFELPSFVWTNAVADFGHCDYLPETANLIASLNAASGNLVDAAYDSLRHMYPDGPMASFGDAAVKAWTAYVSAHSRH